MRSLFLLSLHAFTFSACTEPSESSPENLAEPPALTNAADSLAWRILGAAGGPEAWNALPRLRFDFAAVRDTTETFRARHFWDRTSGQYRVEYPVGEDSTLVAVFDVETFDPAVPTGSAAINGMPLDSTQAAERLAEAYERFVNDTYWMLAPLKVFDPGVRRTLAPDSVGTGVLQLTFEGVGLTPGDQYWLFTDTDGRVVRWRYLLEGGYEGDFRWEQYTDLPTPAGPLRLARRKATEGRAILTEPFPADSLADVPFDDLHPRL
jgi:hypothetical protein